MRRMTSGWNALGVGSDSSLRTFPKRCCSTVVGDVLEKFQAEHRGASLRGCDLLFKLNHKYKVPKTERKSLVNRAIFSGVLTLEGPNTKSMNESLYTVSSVNPSSASPGTSQIMSKKLRDALEEFAAENEGQSLHGCQVLSRLAELVGSHEERTSREERDLLMDQAIFCGILAVKESAARVSETLYAVQKTQAMTEEDERGMLEEWEGRFPKEVVIIHADKTEVGRLARGMLLSRDAARTMLESLEKETPNNLALAVCRGAATLGDVDKFEAGVLSSRTYVPMEEKEVSVKKPPCRLF